MNPAPGKVIIPVVSTEEIYEHIKQNPGTTGKQLVEKFGISFQNLTNKIKRLKDRNRIDIEVIRNGRTQRRHYYPFEGDDLDQDPGVVDSVDSRNQNRSPGGRDEQVRIDPGDYEELFQLSKLQADTVDRLKSALETQENETHRLNALNESLREVQNAFVLLTELAPEEALEKAERRVKIILRYGTLQAAFEKANDTVKQQAAMIKQLKAAVEQGGPSPAPAGPDEIESLRADNRALEKLWEEEKNKQAQLASQVQILFRERDNLKKRLVELENQRSDIE